MASTDAKVVAVKGVANRIYFAIYDADGDLVTGAAGLDSEVSKDGGTFTDCTNEATEIATASGCYYLDLTSTECNVDHCMVIVKTSTSGAKTTVLSIPMADRGFDDLAFPATSGRSLLVDSSGQVTIGAHAAGSFTAAAWAAGAIDANAIGTDAIGSAEFATSAVNEIRDAIIAFLSGRQNTATAGGASTITLDGAAPTTVDFYVGQQVLIVGGTGIGQCRLITAYSAGRVATVAEPWATNPDNTSVFVLLPNRAMISKVLTDVLDANALKADAATEIAAAVWATTLTEPAAIPTFASSVKAHLAYFAQLAIAELDVTGTTAGSVSVRNLADSANVATYPWADDGTTLTMGAGT